MIGAILAGGAGRRIGGDKAGRLLAGRPLASYPAAVLSEVCERVAIVVKPGQVLPELAGVERWDEPPEPRHPAVGVVHAVGRAGEPVLVCAADMPFVTAAACRALIDAARGRAAAVAVADGVLQPVFGVYTPAALAALRAAAPDAPLTRTVDALEPARVELPPALVRSVDSEDELAAAEDELANRG